MTYLLTPVTTSSGKEANETEGQTISKKYFLGPAKNCKELAILGYTLNGFYLVKGKEQSNNNKIEMISCQFEHVSGIKEGRQSQKSIIIYCFKIYFVWNSKRGKVWIHHFRSWR